MMKRKLNIYVSSQMGCVRLNNEDMVLAGQGLHRDEDWKSEGLLLSDKDSYIVAVCDGMGGHNGGEVASEEVASQLGRFFDELPSGLDDETLRESMIVWHNDEHAYLNQRGYDEIELMNMGTTLATVFIYEGRIYWGNCGDSRVYKFSKGKLQQLSTDHNLFQITHNPADAHIITNCMGGGCTNSFIDVEEITDQHNDGDIYILCSDGLTDMVNDSVIESILSIGGRAKELTMQACEEGGVDNVSACVLEVTQN